MKTYIVNVQVEFTCVDPEMARDRVMGIPFGDHDCGFAITSVSEGELAPGTDETMLPEYRERHQCGPLPSYLLEREGDPFGMEGYSYEQFSKDCDRW